MKWLDVRSIAIALYDKYPDFDVKNIKFTQLHSMVMQLDGFDDKPNNSNEKILEAIQLAWLDEQ